MPNRASISLLKMQEITSQTLSCIFFTFGLSGGKTLLCAFFVVFWIKSKTYFLISSIIFLTLPAIYSAANSHAFSSAL